MKIFAAAPILCGLHICKATVSLVPASRNLANLVSPKEADIFSDEFMALILRLLSSPSPTGVKSSESSLDPYTGNSPKLDLERSPLRVKSSGTVMQEDRLVNYLCPMWYAAKRNTDLTLLNDVANKILLDFERTFCGVGTAYPSEVC